MPRPQQVYISLSVAAHLTGCTVRGVISLLEVNKCKTHERTAFDKSIHVVRPTQEIRPAAAYPPPPPHEIREEYPETEWVSLYDLAKLERWEDHVVDELLDRWGIDVPGTAYVSRPRESTEQFIIAIAGSDSHPRMELYGRYGDSRSEHAEVFAKDVVHVARALGMKNIKTIIEIAGANTKRIKNILSKNGIRYARNSEQLADQNR